MNTHADKAQENKKQPCTREVSQSKKGINSVFQFEDNRPGQTVQKRLVDIAGSISDADNVSLQARAFSQGTGAGQEKSFANKLLNVIGQNQGMEIPDKNFAENNENLRQSQSIASDKKAVQFSGANSHILNNHTSLQETVQMKKIDPAEILDRLSSIKFGGTITGPIRLNDPLLKTPQGITLYEYAMQKMLLLAAAWDQTGTLDDNHFNALLLSYAVDVIGDFISRSDEVYLPRIKPLITFELIKGFAGEIDSELQKTEGIDKKDTRQIIGLAMALNKRDPLTLYMKAVLPLDKAADMIKEMAVKSGLSNEDFFELLLNQFLDQILSLSPEQVKTGEPEKDKTKHNSGNDFPQKEVVGEISSDFYKYIGHESDTYTIDSDHIIKKKAVDHVQALREKVYLKPLKTSESEEEPTDLIIDFLKEFTGLPSVKAREIMKTLISHLESFAPQVTVKHGMWFDASGLKTDPKYKSIIEAQHSNEKSSDIIRPGMEGSIPALGRKGQGPMANLLKERGPRYMRWRIDKDSRAEGDDLPFHLYPVYGCLNYWDVNKWGAGGANYYGDIHFLLKPSVKSRCFYKFTDSGLKRKTLPGLFNDVILKNKVTAAIILGDLLGAGVGAHPTTRIEVVIPGGIDLLKDVMAIVVSSPVPKKIAGAVEKWSVKNKIKVVNESGEIDKRNQETYEPVSGLQDEEVKKDAPKLVALRELMTAVQTLINDPSWENQGEGLLGTKIPSGIKTLKGLKAGLSSLDFLTQCRETAKQRRKKKSKRADITGYVYDTLAAMNFDSPSAAYQAVSLIRKIKVSKTFKPSDIKEDSEEEEDFQEKEEAQVLQRPVLKPGTRVYIKHMLHGPPLVCRVLSVGELLKNIKSHRVDNKDQLEEAALQDDKVFVVDNEPGQPFSLVWIEKISELSFVK